MLKHVTVICGHCQHPAEVVPRTTVSFMGGSIPTFDPPLCSECHRLLRPTPTEWSILLRVLTDGPEPVPSDWWGTYALCNGPCPVPIPTA